MLFVSGSDPQLLDAVSVTVYVPAAVYICDGFCELLVPPSPKLQLHDVGVPPLLWSVNDTDCWFAHTVVGLPVKFATGARLSTGKDPDCPQAPV